jgi:hypothetical protein
LDELETQVCNPLKEAEISNEEVSGNFRLSKGPGSAAQPLAGVYVAGNNDS